MRGALVIATVAALAVARPETYREKEDFQYSRSSSDEGTKSGYYGAQRGNMGGNYERAHNMDTLAQHQMGGLVRTVDGDLGDGAQQRSGSVFSAANSRGVYGSGHYDLSSVQGRNFQEGGSFGDSQSLSSLSSQQAGYRSQVESYSSAANSAQSQNSRYRGYNAGSSDQALYANNMQSADNLQSASQYDGAQSSQGSGYRSQSGYQGQSNYDQAAASQVSSNAYGTSSTRGTHYRLVGASPVRVYVRPGSTVTIPVAAQSYDASQGSSSVYDQNSQSSGSTFNQNSINSEAEVAGTDQQSAYRPTNSGKRYESSYSYRKEWEKHDTVTSAPLAVPTVNPYPSNSELYEDSQVQGSEQREASAQEARNIQSSSQYRGYNTKSASSRQQAAYNSRAQEQSSSSDAAASSLSSQLASSLNSQRAYNGASANLNSANLNSQVEDFGTKPKSYQSSYSYHKSWERQGDPYIIQPSTNGLYTAADSQASQRLTQTSLNQASEYGSQRHSSHYRQGQQGYSNDPDCDESARVRVARSYNLGRGRSSYQQSQNTNEGQEYVGQQSQNLEDLGQQSQNLEDLGQQSQNLEEFGQESQNLQDFGQLSQNLQDLGQQSQNLEDLGQQSQNLKDLSQQSQNLQNFGQESQNLQHFGQESQNLQHFGQESQNLQEFGQQSQNLEDFSQLTQDVGQQAQNQWDQQSQTDAGQQTQNTWSTLETAQNNQGDKNTEQQSNGMQYTGINQQEIQGSAFEINHPSLNQPESHKTQEDKLNPLAHTIFDEHRPDQQITEIGKPSSNTENEFDMGRQPGQTPFYWHSITPNMNQNNLYVPLSPLDSDRVHQEVPDWQKYLESLDVHLNTGYGQNQHNNYQTVYGGNSGLYQSSYNFNSNTQSLGYGNLDNAMPVVFSSTYGYNPNTQFPGNVNTGFSPNSWVFPPTYSQNPNTNLQNPDSVHAITNTQTYITRNNHSTYSTSNVSLPQQSGPTSLTNLWDLIDNIEKQTISGKETDDSYHMYQENTNNEQSNVDLTQNLNVNSLSNTDKVQHSIAPLPSTTEPTVPTTTNKQDKLLTHDVERGDIEPEKQKAQEEAGRGDIGPEDNVESNVPKHPLEILGINLPKPINKTPEEIETLSLTKENNKTSLVNSHSADVEKQINLGQNEKTDSELGVFSLDDQKQLEHHSQQDNWKLTVIQTTTTPRSNYHDHPSFNIDQESQQNTDRQQGSREQQSQFHSFGWQNVNFGERTTDRQLTNFGQETVNLGQQHNLEQQFESFDQQNVNLNQQNLNHHVFSIEHGPDEVQQNMDQNPDNFGQQSEGFQQESLGFEQQSQHLVQEHQQPDNFGQQNEGLQQESLGGFGHNSEQLGQEHQNQDNFGQQNEGFQQESLGGFEQQSQHVGQEHQQPDNFGQQNEGFQQESLGGFGHNSEQLGQEHQNQDNFGQQNEGFQQESLGGFEQQSQHLGQEHQQPDNFGQQNEGFQQESLGGFEQQSENLGQEHQQPDSFGQQNEGFQQENIGDLGQQEQLPQESLSNFDHQTENMNHPPKKHQLEKWGQGNENLEQQSQSMGKDLEKLNTEQQLLSQVETFVPSDKEGRAPQHSEPVVEPEFVTKNTKIVDTPPEPVTEKVGFWKNVGSKFVNAKDKVKSWFSSS